MTSGASPGGRGWLLPLLAIALVLRVACALAVTRAAGDRRFLFPDSGAYDALARGLVEEGRYGTPGARAAWPPGYPARLAAVYAFGGGAPAARLLQALLGTATAWIGARIAMGIAGPGAAASRAGFYAAVFLAIWPHGIAYGGLILTETFAVFLLANWMRFLRGVWLAL